MTDLEASAHMALHKKADIWPVSIRSRMRSGSMLGNCWPTVRKKMSMSGR